MRRELKPLQSGGAQGSDPSAETWRSMCSVSSQYLIYLRKVIMRNALCHRSFKVIHCRMDVNRECPLQKQASCIAILFLGMRKDVNELEAYYYMYDQEMTITILSSNRTKDTSCPNMH